MLCNTEIRALTNGNNNILGHYKFLSSHELPCCILQNRIVTSGESTNSAFRVASVTAKRVLMDVEKRALTNG